MRVRIRQDIAELFSGVGEIEVTLSWVLGYVDAKRARALKLDSFLSVDPSVCREIDLPADVVDEARRNIGGQVDLNSAVNLLLLSAYLLGGPE